MLNRTTGKLVDAAGNEIGTIPTFSTPEPPPGSYINTSGVLCNKNGNPIIINGNYVGANGEPVNVNGKPISSGKLPAGATEVDNCSPPAKEDELSWCPPKAGKMSALMKFGSKIVRLTGDSKQAILASAAAAGGGTRKKRRINPRKRTHRH
jgi:hypothetical protein